MSARDVDAVVQRVLSDYSGMKVSLYDAQRVREMLSAAGWVVEQGWQPIETANVQHGQRGLASDGAYVWTVTRVHSLWLDANGRASADFNYWRPLPAAPEARDDA